MSPRMPSLADAFARARQESRLALIGYLPAGFPEPSRFAAAVRAAAASGLDVLELGLPVPAPHLDGPIIRSALKVQRSLGIDFHEALRLGAAVRRAAKLPVVAMGYAAQLEPGTDPARAAGEAARHIAAAGLDGVLFPDLSHEAFAALAAHAASSGIAAVGFIRPEDTTEGVESVLAACARLDGTFVYVQSCAPQTGGPVDLAATARLVRHVVEARGNQALPVAVGFGIQTPEHVAYLRKLGVEGVIVGTALVEAAEGSSQAVGQTVAALARAARG
ncbi:MAG: tryptophan synthase subunit alpha [Bacillota bacterium]